MPTRLLACPSCARHIRVDEARCPFCSEACPESFAAPGLSHEGRIRFNPRIAASLVGGAMVAIAIGCSNGSGEGQISITPAYGNARPPEPDCSGNEYYAIDPADCLGCKTVAYELCAGGDYTKCACEAPQGWKEVTVDSGARGSSVDAAPDALPPSDAGDGG